MAVSPTRLAVSPDASRLFVVNSGSTTSGLTVIDLQNLTVIENRATPYLCFGIAAASSTRVFLSPMDGFDDSLVEIDLSTAASTPFDSETVVSDAAHIALSPDGTTLIVGNNGYSPSSLYRFDATTSPPTEEEYLFDPGSNGQDLFFSHNGTGFIFPCGGGNSDIGYAIALFDPGDLTQQFGSFNTGAYPNNGAFSIDDRLFFTLTDTETGVQVWDTETFASIGTFPVVDLYGFDQIVSDSSGAYLFAIEQTEVYFDTPRKIGVYSTGLNPFATLVGDHMLVPPVAVADGFPFVQIKVNVSGAFSGTLRDRGRTYSFKGSLASEMSTDFTFTRPGALPPMILRIGSSMDDQGSHLFGVLDSDGTETELSALTRKAFPKATPAPQAGRYTVHLPAGDSESLGLGVGYASFTVSKSGGLSGAGKLGDGTGFTFGAAICNGDYVVLNVPLYRKRGAVSGLLHFRDVPGISDLDGIVSWIRPASSSALNPAGFSIARSWQAARYVPPAAGSNIFAFTSAEISFAADNLSAIDPVPVNVGLNNSVTPLPNGISLQANLSVKSGIFSGRFTKPGETKPTKWKGVVQTKSQRGDGLFKNATGFGTATLK